MTKSLFYQIAECANRASLICSVRAAVPLPAPLRLFLALAGLFALLLFFAPAQTVRANEIKVDEHCSLSAAIKAANDDSSFSHCERGYREDIIYLNENITLDHELPNIRSKITIEGNNHFIFPSPQQPVFTIRWGELTIRNLKIRFRARNRSGPTIKIVNGSLTIIDSQILRCTGKFEVEDSRGQVLGDSQICNYTIAEVNSWFEASPTGSTSTAPYNPDTPHTCEILSGTGVTITATYGLRSGVQCQRVDAYLLGVQSLIDSGYYDAIDIWGYAEQGVQVCFHRAGAIVLVDANAVPRRAVPADAYRSGDHVCARIHATGTLVLTPGEPPPPEEPAAGEETVSVETASVMEPASDACLVTTTGNLNLRAEPAMGDNIIGHVPRGTTLSPITRNAYWFNVAYQGKLGWMSASPRYVTVTLACLAES